MNRLPLLDDPIVQFAAWFEEAKRCKSIEQANAIAFLPSIRRDFRTGVA